jgi:NAD(P)-dependent dehydrogenase (short-subunit alcohol dehydrogenase family)
MDATERRHGVTEEDLAHVYLVTGASRGIGRETVLMLAEPGVGLVLCARALGPLEDVAADCRQRGARVLVVPTDVREDEAVEAAFDQARTQLGRIDGVVHCAAVLAYGRFEDVPAEVWESSVMTTLGGAARVARQALNAFADHGSGRLVFVGSILGKMAVPGMSSYVTAKWGLQGLVRTLQVEARETPAIGVSLVTPAGVDTEIYRLAGTYLGHHGKPPPPVAPPARVAQEVVRLLERPRREVNVGPFNWILVTGFRLMPALYDRLVTPLMSRIALAKEPVEPNPGNVLEPVTNEAVVRR